MTVIFHGTEYESTAALVAALEPGIHADVKTVLKVLQHYIDDEEERADLQWRGVDYVGERPTVYNDDSAYVALERIAQYVGIEL